MTPTDWAILGLLLWNGMLTLHCVAEYRQRVADEARPPNAKGSVMAKPQGTGKVGIRSVDGA